MRDRARSDEAVAGERREGHPARMVATSPIYGVIGSVQDRYTVFLIPKSFAELNEGLDGATSAARASSFKSTTRRKHLRRQRRSDGPSDKAGPRSDDIITAIDGDIDRRRLTCSKPARSCAAKRARP